MITAKVLPKIDEETQTSLRPWFIIFNQYYGPEKTAKYWFDPFPEQEFPAICPWEDTKIIAHYGIEPYANRVGLTAPELILSLIKQAALKDLARQNAI